MKIGIMFSGNADFTPAEAGELSKRAEERGLDGVWLGETTLRDAAVVAALVSASTRKIEVGTSIVNVYTRTPGQLAMMGATLNELSGGRFILGIGASTPAIVEGWHGAVYAQPLKRVEETVRLLRMYFSGERFGYDGTFFSPKNARLRAGKPPEIALAALNRRMTKLAARVADRLIFNLYPPQEIARAVNFVHKEAMAAERTKPEVCVMLYSYVLDEGPEAMDFAKDLIGFYGSSDAYSKMFSAFGFSSEAGGMLAGWRERNREKVRASITPEMVHHLLAFGSIEALKEKLAQYEKAGVDNVLIAPSPFGDFLGNARKIIEGL